jgi:DNA polymerase-4
MRKIVHIDMDAFYASVEAARRSRAARAAGGGRLARRAFGGVRGLLRSAQVRRALGDAGAARRAAVPRRGVRAARLHPLPRGVESGARDLRTPYRPGRTAVAGRGLLDVSENKLGLPSATAVASAIRASIREETQLTASAGIAPNKFLAKIASDWRKPDGQFVIKPAQIEAFLAPLPVAKLPGVGRVMEAKLSELGVSTVAQLRLLGSADLERRFGRWGQRLHELAFGIDDIRW